MQQPVPHLHFGSFGGEIECAFMADPNAAMKGDPGGCKGEMPWKEYRDSANTEAYPTLTNSQLSCCAVTVQPSILHAKVSPGRHHSRGAQSQRPSYILTLIANCTRGQLRAPPPFSPIYYPLPPGRRAASNPSQRRRRSSYWAAGLPIESALQANKVVLQSKGSA